MSQPVQLELRDGYAVYRAAGQVTLDQAVQVVTAAIAAARDQNIAKLLIDLSGLTGFNPPGLGARYFFVKDWARAASGMVRVVLVVQPEMIDREKFGVQVAANSGLVANVFSTEPEALAWLNAN